MKNEITLVDVLATLARMPGAIGRAFANRAHRRMMRRAPVFTAHDMPENLFGKLVGSARPLRQRVLEAPLSKRLCVYYDVSIDAMADKSFVRVLRSVQDAVPFVLEDETGRAVIDPAHAMISAGVDGFYYSHPRDAAPQERELLKRTGLAGTYVTTILKRFEHKRHCPDRVCVGLCPALSSRGCVTLVSNANATRVVSCGCLARGLRSHGDVRLSVSGRSTVRRW